MKIQKTKVKLDHTCGTTGAEVKDLSTKKVVIADQDFKIWFDDGPEGQGVDCGGVEHVGQRID